MIKVSTPEDNLYGRHSSKALKGSRSRDRGTFEWRPRKTATSMIGEHICDETEKRERVQGEEGFK